MLLTYEIQILTPDGCGRQQLMHILSNPEYHEVLSWLEHGKGWIIHDRKRFSEEIMPVYFGKQTKYTSFTRKLNRW